MMRKPYYFLAIWMLLLIGCATNPVTGEKELILVPESQELSIGQEQYKPSRQMQGGDFTVDPELTRYVDSVGQKLAAVSDRELPYEFKVLNNSVPNAWALPGGKIAVNRGLLVELNNEAELAAVLGHEIVHSAARHGAKGMERGMLLQGAVLATGLAISGNDYANYVVGGAQLAAVLVSQKYSRDAEREADHFGMTYMSRAGYDPKAAVSLQETFVRLSENQRQDWLSGLFASHPPSRERVEANREYSHSLPNQGELGTEAYEHAIAGLKKIQPAYAAHDEGRKALSEGKLKEAEALAQKALKIEPREGQFHALIGDIRLKENEYQSALKSYNQALECNDDFFYYYLQRGLIENQLKNQNTAKKDLEKSVSLLPTDIAYKTLGDIALAQGDRQTATEYFRAAAGSQSDTGQQARQSLVRLDLPDNPNIYLKAEAFLDGKGYVFAAIQNPTNLPVERIAILVQYTDASGQRREFVRNLSGILSAGKTVSIPLGLGPVENSSDLSDVRVAIARATIAE